MRRVAAQGARALLAAALFGLPPVFAGPVAAEAAAPASLPVPAEGSMAAELLACLLDAPSREGPEPCGQPHEACGADAACLWRHVEGWRVLNAALAHGLPGDVALRARLEELPGVPSYVLAGLDAAARDAGHAPGAECSGPEVGLDRLEQCAFDLGNEGRSRLNMHFWLAGLDPRRPAGPKEE